MRYSFTDGPIDKPDPAHKERAAMNTKDAVKVVWHYEAVKAAQKVLDDAKMAQAAAMALMPKYDHEFIFHQTSDGRKYMIEVDDSYSAHTVTRLYPTTSGNPTRDTEERKT